MKLLACVLVIALESLLVNCASSSCQPLNLTLFNDCVKAGYNVSEIFTPSRSQNELSGLIANMQSKFKNCSSFSSLMTCSVHLPKCATTTSMLPCKEVCKNFVADCQNIASANEGLLELFRGICELLPSVKCLPKPSNSSTNSNVHDSVKCHRLVIKQCQNAGYNFTSVSPEYQQMVDSSEIFQDIDIDSKLRKIICMEIAPPCDDKHNQTRLLVPCRAMCDEAFNDSRAKFLKVFKGREYCSAFPENATVSGHEYCILQAWPGNGYWPSDSWRSLHTTAEHATTTPAPTATSSTANVTTPTSTANATTPPPTSNGSTPATTPPPTSNGSTPATTPLPKTVETTPVTTPLPTTNGSTPATTPPPTTNGSTTATTPPPTSNGSTPVTTPLPTTNGSTPATTPPPTSNGSTSATTPPPTTNGSTPATTPPPTSNGSIPVTTPLPTTNGSIPATTPPPKTIGSTPATTPPPTSNGSTPATTPLPTSNGSTPATTPLPKTIGSTPATTPLPTSNGSTPATTPPPTTNGSTTATTPPPKTKVSTPEHGSVSSTSGSKGPHVSASKGGKMSAGAIAGTVLGTLAVLVAIVIGAVCFRRHHRTRSQYRHSLMVDMDEL